MPTFIQATQIQAGSTPGYMDLDNSYSISSHHGNLAFGNFDVGDLDIKVT